MSNNFNKVRSIKRFQAKFPACSNAVSLLMIRYRWCEGRLKACAENDHIWLTGFSQCHSPNVRHKEAKQFLIFHSYCPTCSVHLCHCCFSSTTRVRAELVELKQKRQSPFEV